MLEQIHTRTHRIELKVMEAMDTQHRKEMESIRQTEADIPEDKNFIESIISTLSQYEDRISDIKARLKS